jgi:4-diphosphocytidyl-2-C-methyl-D-erythritol kinase
MLIFPNAKINIGLFVTEKRNDGYHNLETVFHPVAVNDVLEIIDSGHTATSLHLTGLAVNGDINQNLVWKAYKLLQRDFPDAVGNYEIHLHKHIAMGAGMGGGSADATFMLQLLNQYCRLGLREEQLLEYALQLGSDCSFFIRNQTCFAQGRGELLEPISVPELEQYTIQIIVPAVHISTADAFRHIKPKPATFDLRRIGSLPIGEWKHVIQNDFQPGIFAAYPALQSIWMQLYEQGAVYTSLTGTGSAIYGLFPEGRRAIIETALDYREYLVGAGTV